MSVWRPIEQPESGYPQSFSDALNNLQARQPDFLWKTNKSAQIIASDYSGQHQDANHEVYSFIVTTSDDLQQWLDLRDRFRFQWLPDGRRISFKQLREPMRRRAYPYFLELAGHLRANLFSFMVDRRVGSFIAGGPEVAREIFPDCFDHGYAVGSIEKMLRLSTMLSLLTAGLRDEGQKSYWLSDNDETLDSFKRREALGRLSSYIIFGLTGWKAPEELCFLTTDHSDCPDWGEDLTAIADLAAGAFAKLSADLPCFVRQPNWIVRVVPSPDIDWRARIFADWLSHSCKLMKHVLVRLEPDSLGEIRSSAQSILYTPGDWRPDT